MKEPSEARANQIAATTGRILFEFSDHYFHTGDYLQSIRLGHASEVLYPELEDAYTNTAWLEWSGGDSASALADLRRGLAVNHSDFNMLSEMGDCYLIWLKKPAEALPYYIRATDDFNGTPWMIFGSLAHAAEKSGDLSRAAVAWRMALVRALDDPIEKGPSRSNLNRVLAEIAARQKVID